MPFAIPRVVIPERTESDRTKSLFYYEANPGASELTAYIAWLDDELKQARERLAQLQPAPAPAT